MLFHRAINCSPLLFFLSALAGCGGGGGGGDGTFSDPANIAAGNPEDQMVITIDTLRESDGQPSDQINLLHPLVVSIKVVDGRDRLVKDQIVDIATNLGELDAASGQILTDADGIAETVLRVTSEPAGSAGTLTATIGEFTSEKNFSVTEAPIVTGYALDGVFYEGEVLVENPVIPINGSTTVKVQARGDGKVLGEEHPPTFSSECQSSDVALAQFGRTRFEADGTAYAIYSDLGCDGADKIIATFPTLNNLDAEGYVETSLPEANEISLLPLSTNAMGLQGTNNAQRPAEQSISASIIDVFGDPVEGESVEFALSTTRGGISLSSGAMLTDEEGIATVILSSGNLPAVVRVSASIEVDGVNVTTTSEDIVISAGVPDQNSFSMAATPLNPGGHDVDGATSQITVNIGDRNNSNVPDGTVVFFATEFGRIDASCSTTAGACSVNWFSQEPRSTLFPLFVDDDGNDAYFRDIFNTRCNGRVGQTGRPCPGGLGQPYGARNTILAYTTGEEDFVDANANGLFDAGEAFVDLAEPFLDHNEDGMFGNINTAGSCHPNCPAIGGNEESFIDEDLDGHYSQGNGIYNGSLCSPDAEASGHCSRTLVTISKEIVIVASGSEPYGAFFHESNGVYTHSDGVFLGENNRDLTFFVSDKFNGVLPVGTRVDISSSCPLDRAYSYTVASTNQLGPTSIKFVVLGSDSPDIHEGTIDATVTVPSAGGGTSVEVFSLPCKVDACATVPSPDFCDTEEGASG